MSRVNFTQLWSKDQEVTRVQSHIQKTFAPLLELPFADGVLRADLSIGTADTEIEHKLGRAYEGWLIVGLQTNAVIYESATSNTNKNSVIILQASSAATATIFFF
jgi:hypothetical protein